MPKFTDQKVLPYSPEQMFSLVADVERYPEFLPWLVDVKVTDSSPEELTAVSKIGYKYFRESYTSKVTMDRPTRIDVQATRGPFKKLDTTWTFTELDDQNITVDFFIDFEFDSPILSSLMTTVFEDAAHQMIAAFEVRAHELYGASTLQQPIQQRSFT